MQFKIDTGDLRDMLYKLLEQRKLILPQYILRIVQTTARQQNTKEITLSPTRTTYART